MKPQWQQTSFWLTGGVLLLAGVAVVVGQFVEWDAAIRRTVAAEIAEARLADPAAAWAFDEWARCNRGEGDYAKLLYIEVEQCNMALDALGRQYDRTEEVGRVLDTMKRIGRSAEEIPAPWPLAVLLSSS